MLLLLRYILDNEGIVYRATERVASIIIFVILLTTPIIEVYSDDSIRYDIGAIKSGMLAVEKFENAF
jgi:hypothetical protein